MNPERLHQVYELYHAALERQPDSRAALLNQSDDELRREVESLLAQPSDGLLNRPAWELANDIGKVVRVLDRPTWKMVHRH